MELQNTYAFILGKNQELSIAEIVSYISARKVNFEILNFTQDFLVLKIDDVSKIKIQDFGGTLKIASVSYFEQYEKFDELNFAKFFPQVGTTMDFGVSVYGDSYKKFKAISLGVKKTLKETGIKSSYFHLEPPRTSTTHVEVINKNLLETADLIFCRFGNEYYVGKTLQIHNPFEFQKRDVFKASQRAMYSISPRLSKIMISFLGIEKGVVLDPFCGFGAILQEAALSGFDVRGIDIEKNCVDASIQNLEWLEKEYKIQIPGIRRKVIQGNAKRLTQYFEKESIDGIVAEPYLGPALKAKPDAYLAKNILQELSPMYEGFFREAAKVLRDRGRICIVSPRFQTQAGTFKIDIDRLGAKFGFRTVDILKPYKIQHEVPILDFEERHKLIREINVLEKM